MLAHWFERGLGQIVAPDENAAAQEPLEGFGDSLLRIVAPDPNYEASRHGDSPSAKAPPPAQAFLSPPPAPGGKVQCEHCHQWTRISTTKTPATTFATPRQTAISPEEKASSSLAGLVLEAAKETAVSMTSPAPIADARNKVFRLCASSKPLSEKLCLRLKKLMQQDPSLMHSRSSHLGNLVSDGYTPLIAAASVNNLTAIQVLLESFPDAWQDVDLQGRTALHVAAELGHVEAVTCLKKYASKDNEIAPVDLMGHTPLGRAITSPQPSARKNRDELTKELFSPGDVSVFGHKTPAKDRNAGVSDLFLAYGLADMPGFRVAMEDATCCEFWSDDSAKALLGVCDGHGDARMTSTFIATEAANALRQTDEYPQHDFSSAFKTACLRLDEDLKQSKANRGGGTTAVLALITTGAIVVANVGDGRCILIQNKDDSETSLEEPMADLTLTEAEEKTTEPSAEESKQDVSSKEEEEEETKPKNNKESESNIVVTALSEDHKPNLEAEKNRIEKAGLSVVAETFEENNEEVTIWKVQRSEMERMAVSRSFGDYEYKSNASFPAEEQAVVAVPDVRVHTRNADRDMFLVLACDGIWDVMSNEDVANLVVKEVEECSKKQVPSDQVLPQVGDTLLEECLQRGSKDNMTVVIVALHKAAEQVGSAQVGRALDFTSE